MPLSTAITIGVTLAVVTPLTMLAMRWLRSYTRKALRARGVNLDLAAPRMAAYMQTLDRPGWHPVLWIKKKWVLYEARRL